MSTPQDPTPAEALALFFAGCFVVGVLLLAAWALVVEWATV